MHYDARLIINLFLHLVIVTKISICRYSDDESYLSLIEFHRGNSSSSLIIASPHGGFLGPNLTIVNGEHLKIPLQRLPVTGCYDDELEKCVYNYKDCLKADGEKVTFHGDARCVIIERSSSPTMFVLTKAIFDAFPSNNRPFLISNKLTRQYVDPTEDLALGTFLLENSMRSYMDYHRLIAISKEAMRSSLRNLFIEFVFHRKSLAVHLGYGFDPARPPPVGPPTKSTVQELISRSGPNIIFGNRSFSYFLHLNGFNQVIPFESQRQHSSRLSTFSTRMHGDQHVNAILFSYPIERLRNNSVRDEAFRIVKAIDQFMYTNNIKTRPSSSMSFVHRIEPLFLFLFSLFFFFFLEFFD